MSTKIYNGVRFRIEKLNAFLEYVYNKEHEKLVERVKARLFFKRPKSIAEARKIQDRWEALELRLIRAAKEVDCLLNWTSGWNIWFHEDGYVYAYSWGTFSTQDFGSIAGIEEYGYWDNTDIRPDGVDSVEWRDRKKNWNETAVDKFYRRISFYTVSFEIMSIESGMLVEQALGIDFKAIQAMVEMEEGDERFNF